MLEFGVGLAVLVSTVMLRRVLCTNVPSKERPGRAMFHALVTPRPKKRVRWSETVGDDAHGRARGKGVFNASETE